MTPCEEKGYKVGDEFVVIEDHWNAKKGEKLTLLDDDGTSLPYFEKHTKGGYERYFPNLKWVEKVTTGGETITRTNGQPFATEASARQQLTAKGLQGTHELVPHEGGCALVPIGRAVEPITLQPGDYVSTEGMAEEQYHAVAKAFMAAGAEGGEYPDPEEAKGEPCFGWSAKGGRGMFHGTAIHRRGGATKLIGRHLTIEQVLGATNAGTTTPQPEETTMTTNPITTLKQARQARDEAEQAYQEALEEAREYLGEGFELTEVGTDGPLADGEDMTDPANWREGDVLECVEQTNGWHTPGRTYTFLKVDSDGDIVAKDDAGDESWDIDRCFRFHHRPA